jgi:membrane protein required for colicin V production
MTLTWFDFVVIGVLIYTTFRGLQRGFVWQLAWIAALVLCFGFAETFSIKLAPHIQKFAPQAQPPLDRWIAMLVLYMGFSFLSFGVARVLRGWIEKAKFVEYDRHLGGLFGFVKGVLICLMGTFFLITLSETARETVLVSRSGTAATIIMDKLQPVLPAELAEILQPYILRLDPNHSGEGQLNSGQSDPFSNPQDILFGDNGAPAGSDSGLLGNLPDLSGGESQGGGIWDRITGAGNDSSNINAGGSGAPGQGGSLDDFLRSLPASMSRELQQSAVNAYQNATPEQRDQLMSQVQSSMPSEVGNVLSRFNQLRDSWDNLNKPAPGDQAPTANRDNILQSILQLYPGDEGQRTQYRQWVNGQLTGVPAGVATSVLADWRADLNAEPTDPDPTTNYKTKLDVRIYRQLAAAGVPMNRLSQSLRQRMQNISRQ